MRSVRLSQLFADGKVTLIVYSFMYGPTMARPCASCTSILDALDGEAPHVEQRVNLVVVAKWPVQRIRQFAQERGWRSLRLLSSERSTYNRDYHGESVEGNQLPALNVFVRRGGHIHHFYNTKLLYAPADPGQNPRHVDLIWPLWNLFDLAPEGRGGHVESATVVLSSVLASAMASAHRPETRLPPFLFDIRPDRSPSTREASHDTGELPAYGGATPDRRGARPPRE